MSTKSTGAIGAHNAKVMNRFDLTKRLVGKLKRDEAVIGGIGNANFDLWALATVAERAPKNLTIVVWDNGIYQITGSQPTPGAATADLVAIARGAGIASSAWAADEDEFDGLVVSALKGGAPNLIAARIDNKPAVATTDRDPVQIRERFMRGLGSKSGH